MKYYIHDFDVQDIVVIEDGSKDPLYGATPREGISIRTVATYNPSKDTLTYAPKYLFNQRNYLFNQRNFCLNPKSHLKTLPKKLIGRLALLLLDI